MRTRVDGSPAPARDDESWERFRLIADNSTDVVYETDTDGVLQWVSPSVTALLGWSAADLVGTRAPALIHPDDLPRVQAMRAAVYTGESLTEASSRFQRVDGAYVECTVRARPLHDDYGTVRGSVVAVRDTRERASTLRALTTLSQGNRVLVRATDEATLLQQMCDTVVEAGAYPFAWYGRAVDDEDHSVAVVASAGDHLDYVAGIRVSWADVPEGQGPTGRALREGTSQVVHDFASDSRYVPWLAAAKRHGFRSSIALPVTADGRIDGALMVYAAEPATFDHMATSLLDDLAADLGYGLARLRDAARLNEAFTSSVYVLAAAVESRDPYTAGHQSHVGRLSRALGVELGLDEDSIRGLVLGASIHDLGKIAIPSATLVKPGRLTDEEWAQLKAHAETGYQIAGRFPWPWPIAEMIRQHHERLDGSGYPRGLRADEILLEARIIAVADTYEAMAQDRPYRTAPGHDRAREAIVDARGRLYDADAVDALEAVLSRGFTFEA